MPPSTKPPSIENPEMTSPCTAGSPSVDNLAPAASPPWVIAGPSVEHFAHSSEQHSSTTARASPTGGNSVAHSLAHNPLVPFYALDPPTPANAGLASGDHSKDSAEGVPSTRSVRTTTSVDNTGTLSIIPESLTPSSASSSRAIPTPPPGEKPLVSVSVNGVSSPSHILAGPDSSHAILPKDPVVEIAPFTQDTRDPLPPVRAVQPQPLVDSVDLTQLTIGEVPRRSPVGSSCLTISPVADSSIYSYGNSSSGAILNTPPAGTGESTTLVPATRHSNPPPPSRSEFSNPANATSSDTQQSSQPTGSQNQDNPTLVILLGNSGSGRSTFINTAIGKAAMVVGNTLEECTTDVTSVRYRSTMRGREYVFVDTPPTDGKSRPENIPESIHTMFPRLEHKNVAIIFLFRREARRVNLLHTQSHRKICKDIIGHDGWAETTLVVVTGSPGNDEEATRKNLFDAWGPSGPTVDRFNRTQDDAWRLIDQVVPE
ncbi:hypothetical protein ONZ45_g7038 [Pleurotus djamor]|nr:hypothetical protein ONZ45_g7038 [Pleurotus djamor]